MNDRRQDWENKESISIDPANGTPLAPAIQSQSTFVSA